MSNKVYTTRLDKSTEEELNFIIEYTKDSTSKILSEGVHVYYLKLTEDSKDEKIKEILRKAFKYIMIEFKKL